MFGLVNDPYFVTLWRVQTCCTTLNNAALLRSAGECRTLLEFF
jgi:hypothetical protein